MNFSRASFDRDPAVEVVIVFNRFDNEVVELNQTGRFQATAKSKHHDRR